MCDYMKKILLCMVLPLVTILFTGCAKDVENLLGSINGFVTDYTNANSPIAGATVTLGSKGIAKTTGSDGRFEFNDLEPGTYSVSAKANNFQPTTKQVTVYAGQKANLDFQLEVDKVDVSIDPVTIVFGKDVEQSSFSITNNSNKQLSYSISNSPDYLKVSPVSGNVAAKGKQAVSISVINRKSIKEAKNGQLTVNVGNDSYIVSFSIEAYQEEKLSVGISPQSLAFTKDNDQQTFVITNNNSRSFDYSISCNLDILEVSPDAGTIKESGQNTISVKVKDYKSITERQSGKITITIEGNTFVVNVSVAPYQEESINVSITPSSLSFDKNTNQLTITIKSNTNRELSFSITTNLSVLTVSPTNGKINANGQNDVNVSITNRSEITEDKSGNIIVDVSGNTYTIPVTIAKANSNTSGGDVAVTRGLQAYYSFDDETANDSRNGYNGTFNGGTMIKDTPNGNGCALSLKKNEYVNIPYAPLDGKKNYSVNFWVKDFGAGYLFKCYNEYLYGPSVQVTEEILLRLYTSVSWSSDNYNTFNTSLSNYQSEKWTMITVVTTTEGTSSKGTNKLYINGKRINTGTSYTNNNTGAVSMSIGGNYGNKYSDPMKIDNVRVYSVSLTDDEVLSIFNSEK